MNDKYILAEDGKTPIPVTYDEWLQWFTLNGDRTKRVAYDDIGGVQISTVFLTLNMAFDDGPPVLWETMIFGGPHDQYQERYTSHDDAVVGHALALEMVKSPKDAA